MNHASTEFVQLIAGPHGPHPFYFKPSRDLASSFAAALVLWGARGTTTTGHALAKQSFDLLDKAITLLGDRDEKLRAELVAQQETIAKAIAAVESIIGDPAILARIRTPLDAEHKLLPGAAFLALAEKYGACLQARQDADLALRSAGRDSALKAREELEFAEADLREVAAEVGDAVAAIKFPDLPRESDFTQARAQTDALIHAAKQRGPQKQSLALEMALHQGLTVADRVARLWAVYEPSSGGQVFDMRRARLAARKDEIIEPDPKPAPVQLIDESHLSNEAVARKMWGLS